MQDLPAKASVNQYDGVYLSKYDNVTGNEHVDAGLNVLSAFLMYIVWQVPFLYMMMPRKIKQTL